MAAREMSVPLFHVIASASREAISPKLGDSLPQVRFAVVAHLPSAHGLLRVDEFALQKYL
jgi:hypothetical protein